MSDIWRFGTAVDSTADYSDGTVVPHRHQIVYYNDIPIGEIEIHMHKRKGTDKITDVSFGITNIVYGVPEGGK